MNFQRSRSQWPFTQFGAGADNVGILYTFAVRRELKFSSLLILINKKSWHASCKAKGIRDIGGTNRPKDL
jgi:hypothetical protein